MEAPEPASDLSETSVDVSIDGGAGAPASAPAPAAGPSSTQAASQPSSHGAFTVTDEGISWQCNRCDNMNPLDAQVCSVCGTSFADVVRPESNKPERDPNMAAL